MLTGVDPERSYPREDQESARRLLFDQGSSYENRDAAALRFPVTHGGLKDVANLIRARLHLSNGAPQLGGGIPEAVPPSGRYIGKYEERGEVKLVNYDLEFWKNGSVCGSCSDDDGSFQVKGVFDTKSEIYRWGETMTGASYTKWENSPSLYESAVVSGERICTSIHRNLQRQSNVRNHLLERA
ncbi:unnamed protein product [Ostreobium quekettii]|uniref:Uncharacterized protein n=1 Tax=Ostreobium quekettii TaxID=121088 RepID=A0A8S1JAI5_9CHLO|nr:unnamed protein product [Ostreobium quekettii]